MSSYECFCLAMDHVARRKLQVPIKLISVIKRVNVDSSLAKFLSAIDGSRLPPSRIE